MTSHELREGLGYWAQSMLRCVSELNSLDAQLGDGDLGTTLERCALNVAVALDNMPADMSGMFKDCASACAQASGSSFGTLLTLAFSTAAKNTVGVRTLDRTTVVALLDEIGKTLAARGGSMPGDKSMLDSIDAVARALRACAPDVDLRKTCESAAQDALENFRNRPNRIGRARMYADKSIGMDDPGMVAVLRMAQGIQGAQNLQTI